MWPQRFLLKLQTLFHRNRTTQRLDDEFQFHLEQQIAENIARGMSREEARVPSWASWSSPNDL
jgi:hypothetical protein